MMLSTPNMLEDASIAGSEYLGLGGACMQQTAQIDEKRGSGEHLVHLAAAAAVRAAKACMQEKQIDGQHMNKWRKSLQPPSQHGRR